MKVLPKPYNWSKMHFSEKLKWYAKKDNDVKNIFADKYKVKFILKKMNIPNLHYAKLITHVRPIDNNIDFDLAVPIEHELDIKKNKITQSKLETIMTNAKDVDDFWDILKEKYNILKFNNTKHNHRKYVIKLNLGWNTMVFVSNNKISKMVCGKNTYEKKIYNLHSWKKEAQSKYIKNIPPKFFAEEFIGYNLNVYEVFCIYGEPRILSVYLETLEAYENNYLVYLPNINTESSFSKKKKDPIIINNKKQVTVYSLQDDNSYDMNAKDPFFIDNPQLKEEQFNMKLLMNHRLIPKSKPLQFKVDESICEKICIHAKEFAKYFEFVRVDFYEVNGKIYFSECTFKPGALKLIQWGNIGSFLSSFWTETPTI